MKKKTKVILVILIIVLGVYSVLFEPYNLKIEKVDIQIKNLPSAFEGIKIVQLSDFHSKKFGRRERKVLEIVDQLNPDFIFITGDFIEYTTKNIESCKEFWQILGKKYENRIYGVLGNHEYWNLYYYLLEDTLNKSGIKILTNRNVKLFLENSDQYIYLIGTDNPHNKLDNLPKAMKGVEEDKPKLLLAHSPDIINKINNQNLDLVLNGHTHGGQIKLPFIRPFWTPTKDHGKYANGLFKIENTYLYVNRGIGTTFLPIRFNCPPEITLIELTKK